MNTFAESTVEEAALTWQRAADTARLRLRQLERMPNASTGARDRWMALVETAQGKIQAVREGRAPGVAPAAQAPEP